MTVNKKRKKWLVFSCKVWSGVLFLLGFGSSVEDSEMNEVVPMYGMPGSLYTQKDKAVKQSSNKEITDIDKMILQIILKDRKHVS